MVVLQEECNKKMRTHINTYTLTDRQYYVRVEKKCEDSALRIRNNSLKRLKECGKRKNTCTHAYLYRYTYVYIFLMLFFAVEAQKFVDWNYKKVYFFKREIKFSLVFQFMLLFLLPFFFFWIIYFYQFLNEKKIPLKNICSY